MKVIMKISGFNIHKYGRELNLLNIESGGLLSDDFGHYTHCVPQDDYGNNVLQTGLGACLESFNASNIAHAWVTNEDSVTAVFSSDGDTSGYWLLASGKRDNIVWPNDKVWSFDNKDGFMVEEIYTYTTSNPTLAPWRKKRYIKVPWEDTIFENTGHVVKKCTTKFL